MKKFLIIFKDALLSSYWFYPASLSIFSIILAYSTITLDYSFENETNEFLKSFLFFNKLSMATARVYLSTLVGAVITVVGVVFSLTILTVSSVSTQFGPRILNNFMRDRGNQLTLGIYTSTFVYASTVLLSLYEIKDQEFIPYLSVFVSYLMALTCVAFLIYYIHHIPASLRVENVIHRVAKKALSMIGERFPQNEGVDFVELDQESPQMKTYQELERSMKYSCGESKVGYVQAIDLNALLAVAVKHDAVLKIEGRPGDFMNGKGDLVVSDKLLKKSTCDKINEAFAVGIDRTMPQNIMYMLSQMMEIGIRAMSPGINDPITAMSCVDWLEAALIKMMRNDKGRAVIMDDNKNPRLILRTVDIAEVLYHVRKGLAEHMASNYATASHLMDSLARLAKIASTKTQRKAIRACGAELLAFSKDGLAVKAQKQRLAEIFSSFSSDPVEYPHEYQ